MPLYKIKPIYSRATTYAGLCQWLRGDIWQKTSTGRFKRVPPGVILSYEVTCIIPYPSGSNKAGLDCSASVEGMSLEYIKKKAFEAAKQKAYFNI